MSDPREPLPPDPGVPEGWASQPSFQRSTHETEAAPRGTWPAMLAVLVAGAILGSLTTVGVMRLQGPGTAEVRVNSAPVQGVSDDATVRVAATLAPSVGTVINRAHNVQSSALGSGVVFATDGKVAYLVTNNHVVEGAHELDVVMPSGHSFKATLVGTDSLDDIAVVSVPDAALPVATFGSSAHLLVGEHVVAIGSPLGNDGSVTSGVISALHRTITAGDTGSSEQLEDVLQTDASINPGNSGGPLADVNGDVIGVNVAVSGNAAKIGYSIPADLARRVAESLINHQPVQHPFLGVKYFDAIDAVEAGKGFDSAGVLVTLVVSGSPAASAGLKVNDILVAVDGVSLDNGQTLGGLIQEKSDGQTISLTVRRGGKTITLSATLQEGARQLAQP